MSQTTDSWLRVSVFISNLTKSFYKKCVFNVGQDATLRMLLR